MCKENLITKDLILINQTAETRDELLERMATILMEKGYVEKSFAGAIIKREYEYSTGLPTEEFGIAIPHTDKIHVKKSIISIATLKESVRFYEMGNPSEVVEVNIIFMLAVKEGDSHINVLTELMSIVQDPDLLRRLYESDHENIEKLMNEKLHQGI